MAQVVPSGVGRNSRCSIWFVRRPHTPLRHLRPTWWSLVSAISVLSLGLLKWQASRVVMVLPWVLAQHIIILFACLQIPVPSIVLRRPRQVLSILVWRRATCIP